MFAGYSHLFRIAFASDSEWIGGVVLSLLSYFHAAQGGLLCHAGPRERAVILNSEPREAGWKVYLVRTGLCRPGSPACSVYVKLIWINAVN